MNWLSNLFSGAQKLFSGAGNAIGGALKTGGQAIGQVANTGAKLGQNLTSGFNPMSMFGGGQTGAPKPATSTPMSGPKFGGGSGSGSSMASFAPALSGATGAGTGATAPEKSGKKGGLGILDQLFPGGGAQGIAGLAAPLLGDMFAPKSPSIPDFNSLGSVQAMQNFKPGNSVSPEYQKMIQDNVGQLREQKVRELQALYHNARPGTDYLTDTNYQRDLALLDQGIQENLTNDLTQAEATFSAQEQDRLSQLAQMDIYQIMAQTGLQAQEAQQFKEMFGNVGNMFLTNATRKPDDMSSLMSLFGGK